MKVISEGCDKQMEVDHLEECSYQVFAKGVLIGIHVLCRKCAVE